MQRLVLLVTLAVIACTLAHPTHVIVGNFAGAVQRGTPVLARWNTANSNWEQTTTFSDIDFAGLGLTSPIVDGDKLYAIRDSQNVIRIDQTTNVVEILGENAGVGSSYFSLSLYGSTLYVTGTFATADPRNTLNIAQRETTDSATLPWKSVTFQPSPPTTTPADMKLFILSGNRFGVASGVPYFNRGSDSNWLDVATAFADSQTTLQTGTVDKWWVKGTSVFFYSAAGNLNVGGNLFNFVYTTNGKDFTGAGRFAGTSGHAGPSTTTLVDIDGDAATATVYWVGVFTETSAPFTSYTKAWKAPLSNGDIGSINQWSPDHVAPGTGARLFFIGGSVVLSDAGDSTFTTRANLLDVNVYYTVRRSATGLNSAADGQSFAPYAGGGIDGIAQWVISSSNTIWFIGAGINNAYNVAGYGAVAYDSESESWVEFGRPLIAGNNGRYGVTPTLRAVTQHGKGENIKFVIGGTFAQLGGNITANSVAQADSTGAWAAMGDGLTKRGDVSYVRDGVVTYVPGNVHTVTSTGSGDEAVIYAGGDFSHSGAAFANNVAKFSGGAWSGLGGGVNGLVRTISAAGGNVFVGGAFTASHNFTSNHIAVWNEKDEEWSSLALGVNGDVWSIRAISKNVALVGGSFTVAGGYLSVPDGLALWDNGVWKRLPCSNCDVSCRNSNEPVRLYSCLPAGGVAEIKFLNGDLVVRLQTGGVFRYNGRKWFRAGTASGAEGQFLASQPKKIDGDFAIVNSGADGLFSFQSVNFIDTSNLNGANYRDAGIAGGINAVSPASALIAPTLLAIVFALLAF